MLALLAASPTCDAFAPGGPRLLQRRQGVSVGLSASPSNRDEDDAIANDGWRKKATGSAAAFLAGMGIMAQLAMADPTFVAPIDSGEEGGGASLAGKKIYDRRVHPDASTFLRVFSPS